MTTTTDIETAPPATGRDAAGRRLYEVAMHDRPGGNTPWEELDEPVRESFRTAASHIADLVGGAPS